MKSTWAKVKGLSRRARWSYLALALSIILVGTAFAVFGLGGKSTTGAKPKVTIDSINGVSVGDETKLITIPGGYMLPNVIYPDGGYPMDEAVVQQAMVKGLSSPANLKSWALCGAVLSARAGQLEADAQARIDNPSDPPYDGGSVLGGFGLQNAQLELNEAAAYSDAAKLASGLGIPCVTPGPLNIGHYVTLTTLDKGKQRELRVPDYKVVPNPPELVITLGECATKLEQQLVTVRAKQVDQQPDPRGGRYTFDTWDKLFDIASLTAEIKIAIAINAPCSAAK